LTFSLQSGDVNHLPDTARALPKGKWRKYPIHQDSKLTSEGVGASPKKFVGSVAGVKSRDDKRLIHKNPLKYGKWPRNRGTSRLRHPKLGSNFPGGRMSEPYKGL